MAKNKFKMHLHECLSTEVMMNDKPFSWFKVLHKAFKCPERRYFFWWRLASHLYHSNKPVFKKLSYKINRKLIFKYGIEIELGAFIAPGMSFAHKNGIVISRDCIIGRNFHIRQNTTIGVKSGQNSRIIIGDNVELGANSCVIGDDITIGNNVTIGAMAFINSDIPDNSLCYTTHALQIKDKISN